MSLDQRIPSKLSPSPISSTLRERLLTDPDWMGKLARRSCGLVNLLSSMPWFRELLEKALGIPKQKEWLSYRPQSFEQQAERQGKISQQANLETVLFPGCYVQNHNPDLGFDTLTVLEHNGVACGCVRGLGCCGRLAWQDGNGPQLQRQAQHTLDRLMPYVDHGARVLVLSPSCARMMKTEYLNFVAPEDQERAHRLATAVTHPADYLWNLHQEGHLRTDFLSTPGEAVAYHPSCEQGDTISASKNPELLGLVPGVQLHFTSECCGQGGAFATTSEDIVSATQAQQNALAELKQLPAAIWVSDCLPPNSHKEPSFLHPLSLLARAYRPDGFSKSIAAGQQPEHHEGAPPT